MSRVYVLGAGASHFAGFPLNYDLWPFVVEQTKDDEDFGRRDQVLSQLGELRHSVGLPINNNPNLEELFTFFDLAALDKKNDSRVGVIWPQLKPKIVAMMTTALLKFQEHLHGQIYNTNHSEIALPSRRRLLDTLDAWASRVQPGDVIVSFNWDILCEVRLWLCNKWHYSDGYGFPFAAGDKIDPKSPVKILKLHGSINWVQEAEAQANPWILHTSYFFPSDSGPEGGTEFDDLEYGRQGQSELGQTSMVIPSYLKAPAERRALVTLWNHAATALRSATEIFVIGYRLYPADGLARYLFASSLLDNHNKPAVCIVSPTADDSWDDLCALVGIRAQRHKHKFENWLL